MHDNFDQKDEIFTRLYDTYAESLRRYLRSQGIVENLDDCVQDSFLRLYDRMGDTTKPIQCEKLVAYLYRIARNLAYDHHRRQNNRATHIETGIDDTFLQNIPDTTPSPEETYAEKELLEEFVKAIEKLPEKIAEAVKGLLDGKTLEVIALEAGIQIPALKYRLRRARSFFKNGWE